MRTEESEETAQIHKSAKTNAAREQNLLPSLDPAQMCCDRDPRLNSSGPQLECNETQVELRKKQVFLQKALPDCGFSGYLSDLSARAFHSVI